MGGLKNACTECRQKGINDELTAKDNTIEELQVTVAEQKGTIEEQQNTIENLKGTIEGQQNTIENQSSTIDKLTSENIVLKTDLTSLRNEFKEFKALVAPLVEQSN